jgi:putative DNA primase/helicase
VSIDTEALKGGVDLVSLVGHFTALKKRGTEYVGLCVAHADSNPSMWVNPRKGFVHCFSCGFNADAIQFVMHMEGLDFKAACEFLGAKSDWTPRAPIAQSAPPRPDRTTSKPPAEAGAPSMAIRGLGEPSRIWPYRDTDGVILGYVARYETDEGKQIRCWTWGARGSEEPAWGCGHWNAPRPLYGLDKLSLRPDAPVLVVEGEKAADAAAALLGAYVVVTWPGGSQSWHKADWSAIKGRKVLLWPDNDAPGNECMGKLAPILADPAILACMVKTIDPSGMPDGFDAADWTQSGDELIAWAKPRAEPFGVQAYVAPQADANDGEPPIEAYAEDVVRAPGRTEPNPRPKANGSAVLGEVFYRAMSEIEARPIDWLWPGRIAKGKVSMIVGNPGLGKSQVCASLTSVVSNGGMWPVDRSRCKQGSVVILSAEDDPEDTIRPRLEAAQANLDNVFILDAIRVERQEGDGKRGFDLTHDIARLGALLHSLGDAALVIIDPITAYLGDADSHKNAEVRALLAPLSEMASALRVAVIAVSHLTKSSGMDALLRVQGSIGFAAAARAVWGVAKDKDNPQRRLFMPLKNNLGTDTNGFAYSVEGIRLPESDIETSHVMWENQIITQSADEVFGAQESSFEDKTDLLDAKMYLRSLLADAPVPVSTIERDAKDAGHSWATIRRAQKDLGITSYRGDGIGAKGKWFWRLSA